MSLIVMKAYSAEFKADAVALYLPDPSHTFEGIGKDLGVSCETLRNWIRGTQTHRCVRDRGPAQSSHTPVDLPKNWN